MRRALRTAAALLALSLPAVAEEPPAALIEATEQASALCTALGGTPGILDGYMRTLDLNGDGRADFLTDLGRLECDGARAVFCGPSGCPVAAWLSEPDGSHSRFDLGRMQGFHFWLRSVAGHPAEVYPGQRWAFWQYTGTGMVEGIDGLTDINVFGGTRSQWASFAGG